MKSPVSGVRSRSSQASVLFLGAALALAACSTSAPEASPSPSAVDTRPIAIVSIESEALADNLIGDPSARNVTVYLPPQYFTSEESFPVVYYLAGHSTGPAITNVQVPRDLDQAFETIDPMIVVIISGNNRLQGSFYVDSTTTGGWGTFVAEDVVSYVDASFRTIPDRDARGIAGHSMGGFGALDLAMRHPDVFGSVYALAPGLFDENGISEFQVFSDEGHIRATLSLLEGLDPADPEAGIAEMAGSSASSFDFGYGMAFAPTDEFPYLRYPYSLEGDTLVRDDEVWALWESGFGGIPSEVAEFGDEWASLNGIGIDCGSNDGYTWIPKGCAYLDAQLTAAGIDHVYATHTGDHQSRNRERVIEYMLPFFEGVFAAAEG